VKVGEIPEVRSVDYVATVTADATWANGSGEGLLSAVPWVNDPGSTITLTTGVSSAALTFDTVVTASVIRVVESAAGNLVLTSSASLEHEIESLDLEQAAGRVTVRDTLGARYLFAGADTVLESRGNLMLNVEEGRCLSLAHGIGWTADDTVGSGGHVRFLGNRGALAAPPIQAAGAIVSYEKATVTRAADNEFSVLRTLPGDEVVYNANGKILLNPLHVRGGSLTLRNSSSGRVLYYGSVRDVQARHSSIEVSGGRLIVETTGTGTSNQDCGLLVGTTSTTVHQPNIAISDGEMDLGDGRLTMWERSDLTVSGGKLTAQGLWKGGGGTTTVRLSGDGVISLGAGGIGKSGSGSMAVTLAGGTLQARATLTNALTTSIAGTVRLEALPGHTMTFATAPTGSGTLLCGSDAARGTIAFVGGLSSTLTLDGSFTACLTAAQAASDAEVALFKTGPSFDRTKFTLLGPNGSALPSGEVRYVDGMAIWMPASAAVDVGVNGVAVRVPRTWLAAQGIDATELADNHALTGLNGLPVAASYWLGLEPTNAQDGVTATISVDATGGLTLDLPKIDADRQPNAAAIRYVIQSKAALDDEWQDLSTNAQTTVTIPSEGQSARFFRYLILFR